MSRCFPYPPPGYAEKPRSEHEVLLRKEKYKDKKHKKENREKEKREGKEKDKDRRKDKHKKKKEKHKDKKKDKGRGKDKNRVFSENTRKNDDFCDERPMVSKQYGEVKDTRLTDQLVKRILGQEGQTNHIIRSISGLLPQSTRDLNAAGAKETERISLNRVIEKSGNNTQEHHGMVQKSDKIASSNVRIKNGFSSKTAMHNVKSLPVGSAEKHSSARHNGNGVGLPQEISLCFAQSSSNGIHTTSASEARRCPSNRITPSPNYPQRMEQVDQQVEIYSHSVYGRTDGLDIKAMVKENGRANQFDIEQISKQVEQSNNGTVEGKANIKEEASNYDRRIKGKYKNRDEKKRKNRNKHRGKEKDKRGDKDEQMHKELDALAEGKNQIDDHCMALLNEKSTSVDSKKRKDLEANGSIHEHDIRTTKLPRIPPTKPPWDERVSQHSQGTTCGTFIKSDATNISEADRHQDIRECHNNGFTGAHHLDDFIAPVSFSNNKNDLLTSKPPHPDSKYLSQVYSVPAMDEYPEYDDQEWLFYGDSNHIERPTVEVAESPHVWAKALMIDYADTIALPYVVPL